LGTGGLFLRKLRAKVVDEPTGFIWLEKGKLAASGYPASRSQVEWLSKSGIRSILSLAEQPLLAEWTQGLDIVVGHVAMEDHRPPSVAALSESVNFVLDQLSKGRPILVHCMAGEGRTGCVLAAYLIQSKKIEAGEAMNTLRKLKPGFVEWRQEQALREFASSRAAVNAR